MTTGSLSQVRLECMHEMMAGYVERGDVPGVVTLVRRGETHIDAFGMKAIGGSEPMQHDTLFRIASLTKPITAAAAMILVEECKLRLDEPVDRLLPELADRMVLNRLDGPPDDTVPANRLPDDAEQGPARSRTHPVAAIGGVDDNRPPDARGEGRE